MSGLVEGHAGMSYLSILRNGERPSGRKENLIFIIERAGFGPMLDNTAL
jgi:hypothetical protein